MCRSKNGSFCTSFSGCVSRVSNRCLESNFSMFPVAPSNVAIHFDYCYHIFAENATYTTLLSWGPCISKYLRVLSLLHLCLMIRQHLWTGTFISVLRLWHELCCGVVQLSLVATKGCRYYYYYWSFGCWCIALVIKNWFEFNHINLW